jgi:hypothetical protein
MDEEIVEEMEDAHVCRPAEPRWYREAEGERK